MLPSISGIVYQDMSGGALTATDPHVANATVNLFRDGGDGVFEGKSPGSDDMLVGTATSDANGAYNFTNLNAGTYFVQEIGVPGLIVPEGTGVQKVVVTTAALQGAPERTIDSFASTEQYVSGSLHGGRTGASSMSTPDAIGGHRNMYVQLTSFAGSVSLGADADFPGLLDFASGRLPTARTRSIGTATTATQPCSIPTGLGQVDITNQGAATGIELSLGADHDNGYVTIKVYSDANNWSTATVPLQNTSDGSLGDSVFVAFGNFAVGGGSGANFSKVGRRSVVHHRGQRQRRPGGADPDRRADGPQREPCQRTGGRSRGNQDRTTDPGHRRPSDHLYVHHDQQRSSGRYQRDTHRCAAGRRNVCLLDEQPGLGDE